MGYGYPSCGQTDRHVSKHYLPIVLRTRAVKIEYYHVVVRKNQVQRVRTGYDQARIGSVCRNLVNLQNAKKNCPPPWIAKKDKATPRICKKKWGYSSNLQKKIRVLLWLAKKWGYSSMQQWFHPIDGSVRQQSGEYPHFFLQKKKRYSSMQQSDFIQ